MAMAFIEDEGGEPLNDEVLVAAVDAALANHHHHIVHHPPSLSFGAPPKKLTITHFSSVAAEDLKPPLLPPTTLAPSTHHHQRQYAVGMKGDVLVVTQGPQIGLNHHQQSFHSVHRDGRISPGVCRDSKAQGFMKSVPGGTCNWSGPAIGDPDVKPNGQLKNAGVGVGGGRGGDVKQEAFPLSSDTASASAWSGRRPLQEIQPWVGSNQIVERPSSTSTWIQAEKTSCSPKENDVAWFSGLSGVAMFKECQDAAMRTLVPTDYTMMNGKPFIKKSGRGASPTPGALVIEGKRDSASQIMTFRVQLKQGRKTGHAKTAIQAADHVSLPLLDLLGVGEYKSDGGY